jgi:hypothetical protein
MLLVILLAVYIFGLVYYVEQMEMLYPFHISFAAYSEQFLFNFLSNMQFLLNLENMIRIVKV